MRTDKWRLMLALAACLCVGFVLGTEFQDDVMPTAQADIIDDVPDPAETPAEAAKLIRQRFAAVLNGKSREMQFVHAKLVEHGTANIAAALNENEAGDSAQLATLYNRWKADVESVFGEGTSHANPSKLIPDIP